EHVVRTRDEIDELHFADWPHTHVRRPSGRTNYRDLRDRSVDDAPLTEASLQPLGHLERATIGPDVLAEAEDCRVPLHLLEERLPDAFQIRDLSHRACPSPPVARAWIRPTRYPLGTTALRLAAGRHICQPARPVLPASATPPLHPWRHRPPTAHAHRSS